MEKAGQGLAQTSDNLFNINEFYGKIAVDDQVNALMARSNAIRKGDPNKTVTGPDGKPMPDVGYMGLQGRTALDAREPTMKALDEAINDGRKNLKGREVVDYDNQTRRMRSMWGDEIGRHADTQFKTWAHGVSSAKADHAIAGIVANPDDAEALANNASDLIHARVEQAQTKFGDDPAIKAEAIANAKGEALKAQVDAVGIKDPVRALNILERNRAIAGPNFVPLASHLRARAEQQIGTDVGAAVLADARDQQPVAGVPSTFLAAIKQSEGYIPVAKWDFKQFSSGYGTRAEREGEIIDKPEAERRFAAAVSKAATFVDSINPNLDAGTRAALASLTYNAGTAWGDAGLGSAVRRGDLAAAKTIFLEYNKAGGETNAGLVARRAREAAWFGQGDAPAGLPADQNAVRARALELTKDQSPAVRTAAVSYVTREYQRMEGERALEQQTVKSAVASDLASLEATGLGNQNLDPARVRNAFGAASEQDWLQRRDDAAAVWTASHDLASLNDKQIEERLGSVAPQPGSPQYTRQQAIYEKVATAAADLRKKRNEDPAAAVNEDPTVKKAAQGADLNKPETFAPLVAARIAAQERAGIPEEMQSPITKAEAVTLTVPLRRMLPGQEREVLTDIAEKFKATFGDQADAAFEYALRVHRVDAATAQMAGRVMKRLGLGHAPDAADARALDSTAEIGAAEKAVTGTRAIPDIDPMTGAPMMSELPGGKAPPPNKAVQALRTDPNLAPAFDAKYGAGSAKKILEAYPVR